MVFIPSYCRAWRVLQQQRVLWCLEHQLAAAWTVHWQQVRHKGQRAKQPHIAKEKEKWLPKQRTVKEKIYPKNWGEFLKRRPVDDVWIRTHYPKPQLTFHEAVKRHHEYAQPALSDNATGLIYVTFSLDLRTKKKTKFLSSVKKTIRLPHNFDDGSLNRVIAFCNSEEDRQAALAAGATYAGSADVMKLLISGELTSDDYEHVVATGDVLNDLVTVRKYIRDRFPHKNTGNLGPNLAEMVEFFVNGKTYEMTKIKEEEGTVRVTVGRLDMSLEHIVENYRAYVEALASHRPFDLGPFMKQGMVECPPSEEVFMLEQREMLPAAQRHQAVASLQQEEEEEAADSDDETAEPLQARANK